jgi:hypothetical protein
VGQASFTRGRIALLSLLLVASCGGSERAGPGVTALTGWQPPAKGLWIWYFGYTGLTAAQAAQTAKDAGVGYVLIKSGQDASYWDTRYNAASVGEFTSRGLKVFAWPYMTPANVPGSVQAAALAARVPGTSGLVLDVEIEFEGGHDLEAQQLCEGIRSAVPGVWLGYTSFGWVGYHPTFPFHAFDRYCGDAFFPQVYWSDRGVSWSSGYAEAMQMLETARLQAPVWLVQSNDDTPQGASPATADLNAFFDLTAPYSSLWEFPSSASPAKLSQLALLHWTN